MLYLIILVRTLLAITVEVVSQHSLTIIGSTGENRLDPEIAALLLNLIGLSKLAILCHFSVQLQWRRKIVSVADTNCVTMVLRLKRLSCRMAVLIWSESLLRRVKVFVAMIPIPG